MTLGRGFTLIELILVIIIVGIVASLAVSAYQTYTVRAQVAEGLSVASSAQAAVAAAHAEKAVPPTGRLEAGMSPSPTDSASSYVSQVDIDHGRVDLTFGNEAHADIQGDKLSLTPYLGNDDTIVWRCGAAPPPTGELLSPETSYEAGDVDLRYLPGSCR